MIGLGYEFECQHCKPLNPTDEARVLKAMVDSGISWDLILAYTGHTRADVQQRIMILEFPQEVRDALDLHEISYRYARSISQLPDEAQASWLARANSRFSLYAGGFAEI